MKKSHVWVAGGLLAAVGALLLAGRSGPLSPALQWVQRSAEAAIPQAWRASPQQGSTNPAAALNVAAPAPMAELAALNGSAGAQPMKPTAALMALKKCYFANSCGLGGGEGLDAHFAASKAIVDQFTALQQSASLAEQADMARDFITFPDGHVQAAALALAAKLPADPSTVNVVVAALRESYDAVLLEQAYPVLRQWQGAGMTSGYDDMLSTLVKAGGWHAAQSVAENLTPFLNDGNVERFEAIANQLVPGARQNALRQSLRNYRLQRSGG